MIRSIVARNGRPHQAGPFFFTFAHARSYIAIRSIFQFVTASESDHEVVIALVGIATTNSATGRLITSIDPADTRGFDTQNISLAKALHSFIAALLSPAAARRFPFFAPLRTRPRGSLRFWGLAKWGDLQ
jgi:hypothetical protein